VIPPARTGRAIIRSKVVKITLQTNKETRSKEKRETRILYPVQIKFMAPKMEEAPAKCRLKIAKSTLLPLWAIFLERGGYTVHPVPAPESTKAEKSKRPKAGGSNQKERLFIRGNDISGALIITGRNQLPNPPIKIGITIKKLSKRRVLSQ